MEGLKENIHQDFKKLRENKDENFDKFYKDNYNLVYRICFSILKSKENSEDVTHNVFEKIYKLPGEKLASNYESTWLYTVAKNESIQYIRKNKFNMPLDEQLNEIESSKDEINAVEESEAYKKLVKKLNKKQEQIISLKVLSNFTFKEIGQMLSMPTATVQWHYYSSIKSLKLAIGNLAMFIVAFVIGLKMSVKVDNSSQHNENVGVNTNKHKQSYESYSNNEDIDSSSKIHNAQSIPDIMQDTTEQVPAENLHNFVENQINLSQICAFSLAGIFLFSSIIFGIMFAKRKKSRL